MTYNVSSGTLSLYTTTIHTVLSIVCLFIEFVCSSAKRNGETNSKIKICTRGHLKGVCIVICTAQVN